MPISFSCIGKIAFQWSFESSFQLSLWHMMCGIHFCSATETRLPARRKVCAMPIDAQCNRTSNIELKKYTFVRVDEGQFEHFEETINNVPLIVGCESGSPRQVIYKLC
jgi:hypothetical protein